MFNFSKNLFKNPSRYSRRPTHISFTEGGGGGEDEGFCLGSMTDAGILFLGILLSSAQINNDKRNRFTVGVESFWIC